jgi:hypothetical protein
MHYVLPAVRKSTFHVLAVDEGDNLANCGWPKVREDEINRMQTSQFEYLIDSKHIIRLALEKAKTGGKNKKKGKND